MAAAILEVLAGARTPSQAAEALGVSLPRYFQLEMRAMHAVVASCEPRPRGPARNPDKELLALKRQHERVQRELARQQTLVRMAQRTIGLAPPKSAPVSSVAAKSKKRRRRPVVRALRAAAQASWQLATFPTTTHEGVSFTVEQAAPHAPQLAVVSIGVSQPLVLVPAAFRALTLVEATPPPALLSPT